MPNQEKVDTVQSHLSNSVLSAVTIFGVGQYEWGNTEGYPIQGDPVPAYHRCLDNYPSSDVRVSVGEFVYCGRCDKKYPGA